MVGRRRAEFETEALLEFFGEPRLARGLVAVLASVYGWRNLGFDEALGASAADALERAGITRPAELRARLYALANRSYSGFIGSEERPAALRQLCAEILGASDDDRQGKPTERATGPAGEEASAGAARLSSLHTDEQAERARLTPAQIERALTLDAEDEQLLVKLGPSPTPDEVVERYNFHSLETALAYGEHVRLRLTGQVWTMLRSAHNLARRYRLTYRVGESPGSLFDNRLDLVLFGSRDALGGWGRAGRRLARALLRLLAAHPGCAVEGELVTHAGGKRATMRLDARLLRALGAASVPDEADAWDDDAADELQRAWGRALARGRTAGWRLRRDPEPLVGGANVLVPDFALRRGSSSVALCLAPGRAAATALAAALKGMATPQAVVLVQEGAASLLKGCKAQVVTYALRPADAIPRLVAAMERTWPRGVLPVQSDPWQDLLAHVAAEGFVDEARAASILGCAPHELAAVVRRRAAPGVNVLAGLGICDGETIAELRELLSRGALERAA
jgi:hypothetical protein